MGDGHGLDVRGHAIFVNRAAADMLGTPRTNSWESPCTAMIHSKNADGVELSANECRIHNGFRDNRVFHGRDETFLRKDGTPFTIEFNSTPPILSNSDRVVGAVVSFATSRVGRLSNA